MIEVRKRNSKMTDRAVLGIMALLMVSLLVTSPQALAQVDHNHQLKAPDTAQDHYVLADQYKKKAADLQGEIDRHNQMLAEYSKGIAKSPKATGENSYVKNMRLHCGKYIKAAENLESEDLEFAKFHTLRAKELEGK